MTIYAALLTLPTGERVAAIALCWCGPIEEGEAVLAPIRTFGPPLADTAQPVSYAAMNALFDASAPRGLRHYWKETLLRELRDEAIETVLHFVVQKPSPRSAVPISHVHGAARRPAPTAIAFPHRDSPHGLTILSMWDQPDDEPNVAWARALAEAPRPYGTGGSYVNSSWDEQPGAAFGVNDDRLVAIKNRYDPGNLFRNNMNIGPTAER